MSDERNRIDGDITRRAILGTVAGSTALAGTAAGSNRGLRRGEPSAEEKRRFRDRARRHRSVGEIRSAIERSVDPALIERLGDEFADGSIDFDALPDPVGLDAVEAYADADAGVLSAAAFHPDGPVSEIEIKRRTPEGKRVLIARPAVREAYVVRETREGVSIYDADDTDTAGPTASTCLVGTVCRWSPSPYLQQVYCCGDSCYWGSRMGACSDWKTGTCCHFCPDTSVCRCYDGLDCP